MRWFVLKTTLILGISSLVCAQENHGCENIEYSKKPLPESPDQTPDLLIMKQASNSNYSFCHLTSNDTKAIYYAAYDQESRGIDYDNRTQTIYMSGPNRIEKKSTNDDEKIVLIELEEPLIDLYGSIQDISLDWVAQNLYVLQDYALGIVSLKNSSNVNYLLTNYGRQWRKLFTNAQMIARPNDGYVFIAKSDTINRMSSDGTDILMLTHDGGKPFTIDDDGIIYYTTVNGSVKSMDMFGTKVASLEIENVDTESSIAVDKNYVYYASKGENLIKRANKSNGNADVDFEIRGSEGRIAKFLNLNQARELKKDNPCNFDKENCPDGMCFMVPDNQTMVLFCKGFSTFD